MMFQGGGYFGLIESNLTRKMNSFSILNYFKKNLFSQKKLLRMIIIWQFLSGGE